MNTRVHSFSTKTAADSELVDKLKQDAIKSGKKFSWVVLQALKAYHEQTKAK